MILLDANLLVYAVVETAPEHVLARRWLDARLGETPRVGLPWPTLLTFVRLMANPHAVETPVPPYESMKRVTAWLAQPSVWIPEPTARHAEILDRLLERETGHRIVPDAHLAALAIEHGLVLCSRDRDFARFEGLRWEDPLRAA